MENDSGVIRIDASAGVWTEDRKPCDDCEGSGRDDRGYGYGQRVCGECDGTGLALSPMDRQLVKGVLLSIRIHNEYGWR